MLGLGVLGLLVAAGAWWLGTTVTGPVQVLCRLVAGAAGLYAAYNLVLSGGWLLLTWGLGKWMSAVRRRDALREGKHLVELRFPGDDDPVESYPDALNRAFLDGHLLGPDADCGEVSSGGGAVTCHVSGPDLDRLVAAVRRVAAGFVLPPEAYLWVPDLRRAGFGRVLPLGEGTS